MKKQVDKTHYKFSQYVHKQRWLSMWHQLDELLKLDPERVLEVGPGPGLFKATATAMGVQVQTLDIDPELKPDHVASVFEMPFDNDSFDVVCAFQMLEHLPFEKSIVAFREMTRVAKKSILISLPDAATRWPVSIHIPKYGPCQFSIPRPRLRAPVHKFDGEHYWEINKANYPLKKIVDAFLQKSPVRLEKTFRVAENPYHRFFIFSVDNK